MKVFIKSNEVEAQALVKERMKRRGETNEEWDYRRIPAKISIILVSVQKEKAKGKSPKCTNYSLVFKNDWHTEEQVTEQWRQQSPEKCAINQEKSKHVCY